jgi:hypothetical protein
LKEKNKTNDFIKDIPKMRLFVKTESLFFVGISFFNLRHPPPPRQMVGEVDIGLYSELLL